MPPPDPGIPRACYNESMNIGLYTSKRFLDLKKQALEEAIEKLGLEAEIVHDDSLERPSAPEQAFGFEELFKRAKALCRRSHPICGT